MSFVCNGSQDNNCNDGDMTVRQWQVAFYNFDNMASALLSVVEVGVMDNYMDDVAYQLMDAVGKKYTWILHPAKHAVQHPPYFTHPSYPVCFHYCLWWRWGDAQLQG